MRGLADDSATTFSKKRSALLGGGPRAERLLDGVHVVVDGLRQPDHRERVPALLEERREVGGRRVRVVAADGVQHLDAVLDELVRRNTLRVLALSHEAALDAVLDVGHLDARVADGGTAVEVERTRCRANARRHVDRLAEQQPLVPVGVADDLGLRVLHRVLGDQPAHRRREARRKAARREERHLPRRAETRFVAPDLRHRLGQHHGKAPAAGNVW